MHPPVRNQADIVNQAAYSLEAGTDCSDLPDTARQEFKREADVNYILKTFGVGGALPQRQVSYGEADFDLDLHGAYIAREAAEKAWYHLPPNLKAKYKGIGPMLDAMNSGELAKDLAAAKDLNSSSASSSTPDKPAAGDAGATGGAAS